MTETIDAVPSITPTSGLSRNRERAHRNQNNQPSTRKETNMTYAWELDEIIARLEEIGRQWLVDAQPDTYLLTVQADDLQAHLLPVWKWRIELKYPTVTLIGWTTPAWSNDVLEPGERHQYVTGDDPTVWSDQFRPLAEHHVKAAIMGARDAGASYEVADLTNVTHPVEMLARVIAGNGRWVCPDERSKELAEVAEGLAGLLQGEIVLDSETLRRIDRDLIGRSANAPESGATAAEAG
jgi:hypothetical protein